MTTNWETAEILKTPMEIAWQFDYAISIDKLRNLYRKAKRFQWDAETDLDWDVELDAAKPIIDEGRFAFDRIPFLQKLSDKQRETFRAPRPTTGTSRSSPSSIRFRPGSRTSSTPP
jgi:hypothetical protein